MSAAPTVSEEANSIECRIGGAASLLKDHGDYLRRAKRAEEMAINQLDGLESDIDRIFGTNNPYADDLKSRVAALNVKVREKAVGS